LRHAGHHVAAVELDDVRTSAITDGADPDRDAQRATGRRLRLNLQVLVTTVVYESP
jgi:hypothetical protein